MSFGSGPGCFLVDKTVGDPLATSLLWLSGNTSVLHEDKGVDSGLIEVGILKKEAATAHFVEAVLDLG